jgi:hypothetical protein
MPAALLSCHARFMLPIVPTHPFLPMNLAPLLRAPAVLCFPGLTAVLSCRCRSLLRFFLPLLFLLPAAAAVLALIGSNADDAACALRSRVAHCGRGLRCCMCIQPGRLNAASVQVVHLQARCSWLAGCRGCTMYGTWHITCPRHLSALCMPRTLSSGYNVAMGCRVNRCIWSWRLCKLGP